ncbi:MAG: TonB-dependent receptor [Acidobacteriota bacterium]|nr:TonB-dependent receptor [Acidobacteriota bacterium]
MRRVIPFLMALALVAVPGWADAPDTGTVTGTVSDPSGAGLPGVNITISSDRGEKFTVSGNGGVYRFALLVPSAYNLEAELEGLGNASQAVNVTAGGRHNVDLTLEAATEETITVTSEAAMVDKFNVTAGTTISAAVGKEMAPAHRGTYYSLVNALPGVTGDQRNEDLGPIRRTANGTHFADQSVYIDGVDTTFAKFGGSRVHLPTTALTEVSMEGAGSAAEYGRYVGTSTNVIVKSGTNQFHFDALYQRQDVDWSADYTEKPELPERQGNPYPEDWFKRCHGDSRDDGRSVRPGAYQRPDQVACLPGGDEWAGFSKGWEMSLGGPIKRDKAWFFIGHSDFGDNYRDRLLSGDPYDQSLEYQSRIYKFNLQPSTANSIAISYIDTPARRNYAEITSFDYWTPTPHSNPSDLTSVSWNYSISPQLFLEAKLADQTTHENKDLACGHVDIERCIASKALDRGPQAGHGPPPNTEGGDLSQPLRFPSNPDAGRFWPGNNYNVYVDNENLGAWNNGWILSDGFGFNAFPRQQANLGLTQFIGANHELKYGLDFQDTKWEGEQSRTSFMSGFGYDSYNEFGYLDAGVGGFGALGLGGPEDSCSLTRGNDIDENNPFWDGNTNRGHGCVWVDYNSPLLTSEVGRGSGDSQMRDTAFYVRDRFTVGDHWTFNIGARGEIQEGWNDIRRKVVDQTYVDPRLNVVYDVKGDGKLLFNVNYGNYHAMLNQSWIAGGGDVAGGMHDMWNGYEGYEVWLFCDALEAVIFCPRPDRPDTRADGTVGLPLPGYNFAWSTLLPGRMWEPVDLGLYPHDLETYYKEEAVVGMEWQFSRNWAVDVKYIDWEMRDMMASNTQLDHRGRNIFTTTNYHNLSRNLYAMEDYGIANGFIDPASATLLDRAAIDAAPRARNSYRALQVQLNRRFAGGFAVYNNISWGETDTTGAGAWWNNTNSSYLENLTVVLNQDMIDDCNASQTNPSRATGRTRTNPMDCTDALTQFLGQPVSTIHRRGPNLSADRSIIYNSFGFKTWRFGKNDLTLGGHLKFQSGMPWARSEGVSVTNITSSADGIPAELLKPGTPNDGVSLQLHETGRQGRRENDSYVLNLSVSYGFPLPKKGLRGEFRVEAVNITDQQKVMEHNSIGEVFPARRMYQRPRLLRASFKIGL